MPDDNQVDSHPLLTDDRAVKPAEPARRVRLAVMTAEGDPTLEEWARLEAKEAERVRLDRLAEMNPVDRAVAAEVERLQIRAAAAAVMAADHLSVPVDEGTWADQMALEDDELDWHIQGLAFVGANILLNALAKSGKTTLVLNVIRCLLSGDSLFGRFAVGQLPPGRRVAWWNAELVSGQAREWLRSMDIPNPDSLALWHLRGHHVPLELHEGEEAAVAWLRKYNVSVWVLDPKSALFRGEENSATETGAWLSAIDRIKERAGVDTVLLVHHASETAGQEEVGDKASRFIEGRGSSRTEGWADVIWSYTGRLDEPRYLAALGRDVDVAPFGGIFMSSSTRFLSWDGNATSPEEGRRHAQMLSAYDALVSAGKAMKATELQGLMEGGAKPDKKRQAINYGVQRGYIDRRDGPGNSQLHTPGSVNPRSDSDSASVTWKRPSSNST